MIQAATAVEDDLADACSTALRPSDLADRLGGLGVRAGLERALELGVDRWRPTTRVRAVDVVDDLGVDVRVGAVSRTGAAARRYRSPCRGRGAGGGPVLPASP